MNRAVPAYCALLTCAALASGTAPVDGAAAVDQRYVLELKIVRVMGASVNQATVHVSSMGQDSQFWAAGAIKMAQNGHTLAAEGDTVTWDGRPDPPADSPFQLLSDQRLMIGSESQIESAGQRLQYFERRPDGSFLLREAESPVLRMQMRISPQGTRDGGRLDYMLRVVHVVGREKLPGVLLDVGRPQFATLDAEGRDDLPLHTWCAIFPGERGVAKNLSKPFVFLILRIDRAS